MTKKQLEVLVAELRQELLERARAHDEFMNMFPGVACNIADQVTEMTLKVATERAVEWWCTDDDDPFADHQQIVESLQRAIMSSGLKCVGMTYIDDGPMRGHAGLRLVNPRNLN